MKRLLIIFSVLCLILCSCGDKTVTKTAFMMDTAITYTLTAQNADRLISECESITADYENKLSAHKQNSIVSKFNREGDISTLGEGEFEEMVYISRSVSHATDGAFDITIAPLVKLWGINDADEAFAPPKHTEIMSALTHVGMDKLPLELTRLTKSDPETEIDLGGIAKGYTLGALMEKLSENGNVYGTISFGGNIGLVGTKPDGEPWKVGIKDPFDTKKTICTLSLESGIVSVSGSYERYADFNGKRYHHIIDPKTGYPAESDLVSVAVFVDTAEPFVSAKNAGAYADALSTALFVMGHDKALAHYENVKNNLVSVGAVDNMNFEAVLIKTDGTVTVTDGLAKRYYLSENNQ